MEILKNFPKRFDGFLDEIIKQEHFPFVIFIFLFSLFVDHTSAGMVIMYFIVLACVCVVILLKHYPYQPRSPA